MTDQDHKVGFFKLEINKELDCCHFRQNIKLPIGSEILCVRVDNNVPYLWASINPNVEKESKSIMTIETDNSIEEGDIKSMYPQQTLGTYIGTYRWLSKFAHVFFI